MSSLCFRSRYPLFFTRSPVTRFSLRRHAIWLLPFSAGISLYVAPWNPPPKLPPTLFSSPNLIPSPIPTIFSPSESHRSMRSTILTFLVDNIWEPLLTAKRFIYLFVLFVPVIISTPMLLIGKPHKRFKGDRWGAIWWYAFLVRTMESAGPTFIKVPFSFPIIPTPYRSFFISSPNGLLPVPISSLLLFMIPWLLFTHMENHTLYATLNPSFKQSSNAPLIKFSNNSKRSQLARALLLKSTEQLSNKT